MILNNREGHPAFNIRADWHKGCSPGLSALVRVRNEADWIAHSLASIEPWCDEIVVTLNCCDDGTPEIVEAFRARHPDKTVVREYPFALYPMGPGHDKCPADSVHSAAYFYNWTQSLSTREIVLKWDGDIVALDWLGDEIRRLMDQGHERIKFHGTDLSSDIRYVGNHPVCPTNGTYRVTNATFYAQGPLTQNLRNPPPPSATIDRPAFLHFKWAKPAESATVQWPKNWRSIPHFQTIIKRREPVARYTGEYPASVQALL